MGRERWAAHVREWSPELVARSALPVVRRAGSVHEAIKAGLETNTASTVWQRLRDEQGLGASLASFRRYIHARLAEEANRSAVTVGKDDPPPGEEAQIDYGSLDRLVNSAHHVLLDGRSYRPNKCRTTAWMSRGGC